MNTSGYTFSSMIVLSLLMIFIVAMPLFANSPVLKIAVIDFMPYQGNPDNPVGEQGFMVEIARKIFSTAGYSIDFELVPFARAVKGTEHGEYDVILQYSTHSDKLIRSSMTSGVLRNVFYVRKGSRWNYVDSSSLTLMKVATVVGYDYSIDMGYQRYLDNHKYDGKVTAVAGEDASERVFKLIQYGRVDLFCESPEVFSQITSKNGTKGLFRIAGELVPDPQYVGFSPVNPRAHALAKIYDTGISKMRKSGELARILAAYRQKDWVSK